MKRFKDTRVQTKLIFGFGFAVLIMVLICAGSILMMNLQNKAHNGRYRSYGQGYGDLAMAYEQYQEARVYAYQIQFLYKDEKEKQGELIDDLESTLDKMDEYAQEFYKTIKDDEIAALFDKAHENTGIYREKTLDMAEKAYNGQTGAEMDALQAEAVAAGNSAAKSILDIIDLMDEKSANQAALVEEQVGYLKTGVILVVILGALISVILASMIVRSIKRPLVKITEIAKKLAIGDINVNADHDSKDEFGILMKDFEEMIENTKEQAYAASHIAEGDLSVAIHPRSEADMLGNALKKLVDENNIVMSNIRESSSQVTTGSEQVAAASQSLAQGSTEQASAIEQVSASIQDIAERTRVNAERANEADQLVSATKEDAVKGNDQMNQMIHAMGEINEASENISKIIKVIDDIAFQTNILALNAQVEAARAGSHGKGFAVVAEEVRSLAGRSATAASNTAEMIEDSIRKVEHGSELAQETAKELNNIVMAVDNIVHLINGIAVASNDQATAIAQIDQALSQVSEVVQTNSATSQECAAASEELSNQAENLRKLISRFRLKETAFQTYFGDNLNMKQPMNPGARQIALDENEMLSFGGQNKESLPMNSGYGKY